METKQRIRSYDCYNAESLLNVDAWHNDLYLTKDCRLGAAFEVEGVDPSALTPENHLRLSQLVDNIFGNIDPSLTVTQYQVNTPIASLKLLPRDSVVQQRISQGREALLASENLIQTRLIYFFEIDLDKDLNTLNPVSLFSNMFGALNDKAKRAAFLNAISAKQQILISRKDLLSKARLLSEQMESFLARWKNLGEGRQLSREQTTNVLGFLASFRSETFPGVRPLADQVAPILQGDIRPITSNGTPCIKFDGVSPMYCRVGALAAFGENPVPGFWGFSQERPALLNAPFVLMYRWKPLSDFETALQFSSKRKELERQSSSIMSHVFTSKAGGENLSTKLREKFEELDKADAMRVRWTRSESYVVTYAKDVEELQRITARLNTSVTATGARIIWEDTNLMNSYAAFYPTGAGRGARRRVTNSHQNAAAGLYYKSNQGQPVISTANGSEEALCVFKTPSGAAFHYYPSVAGKGLTLGFGPTRTGKTYFKNTVAAHSLKYGGSYFALDVDPGTEPLAMLLGNKESVFRVYADTAGESGFNLFTSCLGADDQKFKSHFLNQIHRMVEGNLSAQSREITLSEQQELDAALASTLDLPIGMQTLSSFSGHLGGSLQAKLSRWVKGDRALGRDDGVYSQLTDCEVDAVGADTRFRVFNFQNLRDDIEQRNVAYAEIFYRIIQEFESPAARAFPKFLDIDEAHVPLSDPRFQHWITQGLVTWNKYNVLPSLWSQSIEEFLKLERFEAIRSSAGTMIFTADQSLNGELYKSALGLTEGECSAIRSLIPKRQVYIIQREIGVSTVIEVKNDAYTDMIVNSRPDIVSIRDPLIEKYGLDEGLDRALAHFANLNKNI